MLRTAGWDNRFMARLQGRVAAAPSRQRLSRRQARLVGLGGFLGAAALPVILWHRPFTIIASDFRLETEYLVTGWTGYGLIALGLLFMAPVVASIGRRPGSRFYPRSRNAYAAWGVCLYLLGIILASQVAAVARIHPVP
jgi:hypothetical protein